MNRFCKMMMTLGAAALVGACSEKKAEEPFRYTVDSFADLKVMRYQVPGWDSLSLKQKEYAYHLAEAAKYGRDILWEQNSSVNRDTSMSRTFAIKTGASGKVNDLFHNFAAN